MITQNIELSPPTRKSLLVTKACNILLAEEMDSLKETTAYRQDIKNLINTLSNKLDREYVEVYDLYKEAIKA